MFCLLCYVLTALVLLFCSLSVRRPLGRIVCRLWSHKPSLATSLERRQKSEQANAPSFTLYVDEPRASAPELRSIQCAQYIYLQIAAAEPESVRRVPVPGYLQPAWTIRTEQHIVGIHRELWFLSNHP